MRCYICDVELSETEIQLDEENKSEPCTTCLTIIYDTAYCGGFVPDGQQTDEPLLEDLDEEGLDNGLSLPPEPNS